MNELEFSPPWLEYPGMPSSWGGWRQGHAEPWFHAWLARFNALPRAWRSAYLERWNAPQDWLEWHAFCFSSSNA
ncbi:MAG: hypothetical protein HC933_22250 [Pleurocapsa sp. SU_196_0]|nr:hypothetical protein [Pleurocapsa sp. SU_196_0]